MGASRGVGARREAGKDEKRKKRKEQKTTEKKQKSDLAAGGISLVIAQARSISVHSTSSTTQSCARPVALTAAPSRRLASLQRIDAGPSVGGQHQMDAPQPRFHFHGRAARCVAVTQASSPHGRRVRVLDEKGEGVQDRSGRIQPDSLLLPPLISLLV